ncbi:GNAT family N-acetyltransferase [Halorubrum sp. Atlit-8R]|uniref:GNAT family N-acetyltransferase n=1 Tax=unclassified Halorubrum TaxID=2642239 RepID=UPI000EF17EC7|nr:MULTISPECIES: GNAT family N-acetyltransferase [unclassified Halorubrum]RLM67880.1 GNAT family N-acetyltransferase [Halorubrum sp. Atlit-9R]RLM81049.1 GNAT family N-acetyltransferase [Halorubrum sp. Atlit-8R]
MSGRASAAGAPAVVVREARPADADAVAAFTRDTWGERHEDYIPRVFPDWAAADDPDRGTFVATLPPEAAASADLDGREAGDTRVEGDGTGAADAGDPEAVVGCIQAVSLSEWEAWGQGIRVDPAARGHGVGTALSEAALDWARERGATVCRNMVFSWNAMGLGQSRAVGFEPETEFRFAEPEPDATALDGAADAGVAPLADPDPDAAWAFWSDSDARDHLRGLALDPDESWACSQLTRERLAAAAADDRLIAVGDAAAVAGFAVRTRVTEREVDGETTRTATYGVAAWRDADAAGTLFAAVAADAAAANADGARVLIPETVDHVSDVAANRVSVATEPDFVMCADLTGEP